MKNYAVIGTSPIMLITSLLISIRNKETNITIFNKDQWIGGAWRKVNTPYGRIPTHNNIIIPLNKKEQIQLKNIKLVFDKIKLRTELVNTNVKTSTDWQPNLKMVLDIDDLVNKIKSIDNIHIFKEACKLVKLEDEILKVNNIKFQKCLIPSRFTKIDFLVNKKKIKYQSNVNISHHYTFIFEYSKQLIEEKDYSEDFDNFFDRGQLNKISNKYFFLIGRLRREFKYLKEEEIMNIYKEKFKMYFLCYFKKNIYVDTKVINSELITNKYPQIIHINTDQFVKSFIDIKESIFL